MRKMYRAITKGDDLLALVTFDDDPLGPDGVVAGKSFMEGAKTCDAEVTEYGRFGRGFVSTRRSPIYGV